MQGQIVASSYRWVEDQELIRVLNTEVLTLEVHAVKLPTTSWKSESVMGLGWAGMKQAGLVWEWCFCLSGLLFCFFRSENIRFIAFVVFFAFLRGCWLVEWLAGWLAGLACWLAGWQAAKKAKKARKANKNCFFNTKRQKIAIWDAKKN